jgi:hypothetical protein
LSCRTLTKTTAATTTISTTKEKAEVGEKGVIYLDLAKQWRGIDPSRGEEGGNLFKLTKATTTAAMKRTSDTAATMSMEAA